MKSSTKKVVIQTEVTGFSSEDGHRLVEIAAIKGLKNEQNKI